MSDLKKSPAIQLKLRRGLTTRSIPEQWGRVLAFAPFAREVLGFLPFIADVD
ncbi:hypothetical protein ACFFLM_22930 [Deinococcus oregonensis]|uniref:Transposase n=1 Tax=Deinococcus oregonensis TaxID=1805970 RepID=A0ABV6B4X4_9DEIO